MQAHVIIQFRDVSRFISFITEREILSRTSPGNPPASPNTHFDLSQMQMLLAQDTAASERSKRVGRQPLRTEPNFRANIQNKHGRAISVHSECNHNILPMLQSVWAPVDFPRRQQAAKISIPRGLDHLLLPPSLFCKRSAIAATTQRA